MSADSVTFPYIINLCQLPDLSGAKYEQRVAYLAIKRGLDIVGASIILMIASPILLLAAAIIRLESEGPAIFAQERVGAKCRRINGQVVWQVRLFRFYKLRTMRSDSDPAAHKEYLRRFRNGFAERGSRRVPFKLTEDARITGVGRWLRKTSIDELPQLVNVILGDMSLVGPRPVPAYEVELYDESHYDRLAAKPGITGIWQVYGRCRVSFEEMIAMDLEYVHQSSIWLDIKLLLFTVKAVVSLKGAA